MEQEEDWEPILVGATWTTSIVVYRRNSSSQAKSSENTTGTEYMVVSCGSNDFNELGYTDIASSSTVPITRASPCPRIVDLGLEPGDKVEKLACGQRHVMLVISNKQGSQRIIGWGAGRRGEFDLSTLGGVDGSDTIRGAKGKGKGKATARPTTYPPTTLHLPLDGQAERIIDISLGASHTLVLTSKNRVFGRPLRHRSDISILGRIVFPHFDRRNPFARLKYIFSAATL
jgi:protein ATS1